MNKLGKLKPGWGIVPVVIFLLLWEVVARLNLVPGQFFFPPFSTVVMEFYYLIANGVLGKNFISSLVRVLIGFSAGSIAGIAVGIVMGWRDTIDKALHPIVSLLYPIPALGWLPLLMLWIGINEMLPITIIFICSFFPVLYNTVTGIRNVDKSYIQVARTLGASDMKILMTVVMPLALPNIFTGLRLEAGMSWRVIIAAEMVAIPTGIGALMMRAESLIRMDIIIVCLIVLAVMCLSVFAMAFFLFNDMTLFHDQASDVPSLGKFQVSNRDFTNLPPTCKIFLQIREAPRLSQILPEWLIQEAFFIQPTKPFEHGLGNGKCQYVRRQMLAHGNIGSPHNSLRNVQIFKQGNQQHAS